MPRRQAERVEETRRALLDATVSTLAEVGYAATTTREVAARAGVSRGAQTHHYPTKAAMVADAVEHLLLAQLDRFHTTFGRLPADERDLVAAFDALWTLVRSPGYAALLEVMVAARTDAELRGVLAGTAPLFEAAVVEAALDTFPVLGGDEQLTRDLMTMAVSLAQGAALARAAGFGDADRSVAVARRLLGLLTADNVTVVRDALRALTLHPAPDPDTGGPS